MRSFIFILVLSFAVLVVCNSANVNADTAAVDECPLWLAPSNINLQDETNKRFTKYGLYAGRTYNQSSILPYPELVLPLVDFFGDFNIHNDDGEMNELIQSFLEEQLWTQDFIGSIWEGHVSVPAIIPGGGMLGTYHSGFSNANFLHAAIWLRQPMIGSESNVDNSDMYPKSGEAHLLRGAITPYYNATMQATTTIPAGMEIIADFGDSWDGNFTENLFQDKIHRYDYEIADSIVNGLVEFYDKFPNLSLELQEDIMDFMLYKVLGTATGPNAKVIHSLIPANPRKLKQIQKAGGTFMYRYRDMIKSKSWFIKNGFCLNTIEQGISTIPHAGRGAFAARDIKKGETITITPMLHIADKEMLTMYPFIEKTHPFTGEVTREQDESNGPIGQQLLVNYAFGHPESSMVLIPAGPQVTLINHGGKEQSNAYITWSNKKKDKIKNPDGFLDLSVMEMAHEKDIVLVMKIVANKDIAKGEEIFLDYGDRWERAWKEYVDEWEQTKQGQSHPLKADDMKFMYKNKPYETVETIQDNPYPENVMIGCFLEPIPRPDGTLMTHQEKGYEIANFDSPIKYEDYDGTNFYLVTVLDRTEATDGFYYNYTVLGQDDVVEVHNVPHAACTFIDAPYTSDIHIPGAFRHPIDIIDNHFPNAWKNLY